MGKSEIRNYEVFCTTHSRIIQALSLEHAMSKFKDIDDGKIIGVWDSEYYNATETLPVIDETVSHSPTEPDEEYQQFLKEDEEEYRKVLSLGMSSGTVDFWVGKMEKLCIKFANGISIASSYHRTNLSK